jgi:hypothetical protein
VNHQTFQKLPPGAGAEDHAREHDHISYHHHHPYHPNSQQHQHQHQHQRHEDMMFKQQVSLGHHHRQHHHQHQHQHHHKDGQGILSSYNNPVSRNDALSLVSPAHKDTIRNHQGDGEGVTPTATPFDSGCVFQLQEYESNQDQDLTPEGLETATSSTSWCMNEVNEDGALRVKVRDWIRI